MEIRFYDQALDSDLKRVVVCARAGEKWLLCRRGDRQTHHREADGVRGIHRPWEAGVREAGGADGNDDVPSRTRIRRRGAEAEARHEDRGVPGASKC